MPRARPPWTFIRVNFSRRLSVGKFAPARLSVFPENKEGDPVKSVGSPWSSGVMLTGVLF